jgi:hypothetical protein
VTASCGGEYCTEESHVCDYPPPSWKEIGRLGDAHNKLADLMNAWGEATDVLMETISLNPTSDLAVTEAWNNEDAAREAWANQYRLIYGEDPDWSAIRKGCD